jgi:hypothetical protein
MRCMRARVYVFPSVCVCVRLYFSHTTIALLERPMCCRTLSILREAIRSLRLYVNHVSVIDFSKPIIKVGTELGIGNVDHDFYFKFFIQTARTN